MTTAKTTYTYTELVKRSTTQLIAIYNRLFNTNAWDMWFNPYEHRQDMLVDLMAEMDAQKIVARFAQSAGPVERYRTFKINITADGWIITWGKHHSASPVNNRKYSEYIVREVHNMRAAGVPMKAIGDELMMPTSRVFRILKGWVYADVQV